MSNLRDKAEKLRDAGYSYGMIYEKLGISKGSLSSWFKDRPFSPNAELVQRIKNGPFKSGELRHNARVKQRLALRKAYKEELGVLQTRDLWMIGIGLYFGEGAKTIESIRIANSDPAIIMTSIKWLKTCCGLANDNIKIRPHLYPDSNVHEAVLYWQALTGLPYDNFYKAVIDARTNKS